MTNFICRTCGTQYPQSSTPPTSCQICDDDRQYIGWNGQQWTTMEELQVDHHNCIKEIAPNLIGIGTQPGFAISQRALLIRTPQGNQLWDCISLLDEATITAVNELGGIRAIAISHPHFFSSMIEWSRAFDAPIHIHADNKPQVMRSDPAIKFWRGEKKSHFGGITMIRAGGHFPGSTILHWAAGAEGRGALFTGDTIQVVSDRLWVSFMYSYPNLIPLSARKVEKIVAAVEPYQFERIYGGWWDRIVESDAKTAVIKSANRYIAAIRDV